MEEKFNDLLVICGLHLVAVGDLLLLPMSRGQFDGRCKTTSQHGVNRRVQVQITADAVVNLAVVAKGLNELVKGQRGLKKALSLPFPLRFSSLFPKPTAAFHTRGLRLDFCSDGSLSLARRDVTQNMNKDLRTSRRVTRTAAVNRIFTRTEGPGAASVFARTDHHHH